MDKIVISKPEEAVADRLQMLDSFRFLHPEAKDSFTCWNTQKNARSTNYGTRIDYLLLTHCLAPSLSGCRILSDLMGSDHCPVRAELKLQVANAGPPPSLCSKFLFLGRQQKLHSFFTTQPKEQQSGQTEQKKAAKSAVRKQTSLVGFLQKRSEVSRQGAMQVEETVDSEVVPNKEVVFAWKGLLTGPKPVPPCDGHNEPCVVRTVRKAGPNLNRQFYCCARGEGHKDNPESRCNFFQWAAKR
jgi:AP endonuclease 2